MFNIWQFNLVGTINDVFKRISADIFFSFQKVWGYPTSMEYDLHNN